jgi:hypothetical protein
VDEIIDAKNELLTNLDKAIKEKHGELKSYMQKLESTEIDSIRQNYEKIVHILQIDLEQDVLRKVAVNSDISRLTKQKLECSHQEESVDGIMRFSDNF